MDWIRPVLCQACACLRMKPSPSPLFKTGVAGAALSIIVLIWAFVFIQVRYERREAVDGAIRANIHRVVALEQYVARTLERADLATTYIANQYADRLQQPVRGRTPITVINDAALRSPALREINVFNRNGDLIATNAKPVPKSLSVFRTKIFQGHLTNPSTALQVHPPERSRFTSEWLLLLTRRVNLPDGNFGGTVSVQVRPSEITDFLRYAELDDTDLVSVIGLDGITRARREGNTLSFGQDLRGKLVMRMQERNPNGTYLGPSSIDGLVRYFSHRRLPQYGLFVTSGVSEKAVLEPVRARANGYFIGGTIITLGTIIAAWLLLTIVRRRIAHEAEILRANERLEEAQKLAKLGDWRFDVARKEFRWSNDLCAMYERPVTEEPISLNDYGKLVGQHGVQIFEAALKQSESFSGRQEFELVARLPSGAVSHRRVVSVPDFDASRQLVGMHGTDQDITPRKLLESLRRQVSHLSKLDALNAIAATLAHELNQPLTAASNYLSGSIRLMSARADPKNEMILEALAAVREQIYHAGEIIRRVRNLIGNGDQQVNAIAISEVIISAVTRFEAANPGCNVSFEPGPDVDQATVLADPVQIQQILANLLRNAEESCGASPQIHVRTRRGQAKRIDVCVIDNGPGITNDGRDLFSSLTTSKGSGLGLGLAICRTLIESMGGQIWIEDTGPDGTIICFNVREDVVETDILSPST